MPILLSCLLIFYNNLINLWSPFRGTLYVPCNLALTALLVGSALGPLGLSIDDLGLRAMWRDLILGAILGAIPVALLFAAALNSRVAHRVADARAAGLTPGRLVYNLLVRIPLGTALTEELAFRGVLFAVWRQAGIVESALISSAVFGLWHITPSLHMARANSPASSPAVVVLASFALTTIAGLAFVWLRVGSGGIAAPVAAHAVLNSGSLLAAFVAHKRISEFRPR